MGVDEEIFKSWMNIEMIAENCPITIPTVVQLSIRSMFVCNSQFISCICDCRSKRWDG